MQNLNDCVQHVIRGVLWRNMQEIVLTLGDSEVEGKVLAQGEVVVRYAIPFLARPQLAVVPCLFVSERGAILKSWQAWRFVHENFQLYPRAEIMGLQSNGDDAQVFLRELDFGSPSRVLAYASLEQRLPLGQVSRLIRKPGLSVPDVLAELLS